MVANNVSYPAEGGPEEVLEHLFCLDMSCICRASLIMDTPRQGQWPMPAKNSTNASKMIQPVSPAVDLVGRIVLEVLVPSLVFVLLP